MSDAGEKVRQIQAEFEAAWDAMARVQFPNVEGLTPVEFRIWRARTFREDPEPGRMLAEAVVNDALGASRWADEETVLRDLAAYGSPEVRDEAFRRLGHPSDNG